MELRIEGDFTILAGSDPESVTFDAVDPGQPWYGILLDPGVSSRIDLPGDGYQVLNATSGIHLTEAPPEVTGKVDRRFRLSDSTSDETAGNGDGRLSPGESFKLEATFDNWTLTKYEDVRVNVRWNTPLAYPTWESRWGGGNRLELEEFFSLYPGNRGRFVIPSLTLSPAAQAGERLEFVLEAVSRQGVFRDTLRFAVVGRSPLHRAQIEIAGKDANRGANVIRTGWPTYFRAQVEGDVARAFLVVRSLSGRTPTLVLPMNRRSVNAWDQVFTRLFWAPEPDQYQVLMRFHDSSGGAAFSDAELHVWAEPGGEATTVLALLGNQYDDLAKTALKQLIAEAASELGLTVSILDAAPTEAAAYRALLPHYRRADRLVIWMGQEMEEETQAAFRDYLEGGGRLMLVSFELHRSPNGASFLREVLHAGSLSRRARRRATNSIESLELNEAIQFRARHYPLNPLAPATAILQNGRQQAAGLQLDTGVYRLQYLPLDLGKEEESVVRPLLEDGMRFLLEADPGWSTPKSVQETPSSPALFNYPNPFNAQTVVSYQLAQRTAVTLTLYNAAGQVVRRLVDQEQEAGRHQIVWNGRDAAGNTVGNGVYLSRLTAGDAVETQRLLLLK